MLKLLKNFSLQIDKDRIKQFLQLQENMNLTPELELILQQCVGKAQRLIKPQALWITQPKETALSIITGQKTLEFFQHSEKITFLAVTIGKELVNEANSLMQVGNITQGFILDAIGSDGVEQATDIVNEHIVKDIRKQGYYPTLRFSPGYGDWPLEKQRDLSQLIQTEQIGVSITNSFMLEPMKSVTAAIGWSTQEESNFYPSWSCQQICTKEIACKNCIKHTRLKNN